jgi:hypothetical protein
VTAPGRLAVILPTTGVALRLLSLVPRPGLPHGAAFAEGDYRPLALSPDYRALVGPEGPIARHLGLPIPPHELRLSGAPESGRSWEAPVALAHLLLARGWTLTPDPAEADLTLWATGAVDLDLTLLPGDYAPERKVALSLELLSKARSPLAILPPGTGREAADAALRAEGITTLLPKTLAEVLGALTASPKAAVIAPEAASPTRPTPSLRPTWVAAALVVVAGAVAFVAGAFDPWLNGDQTVSAGLKDSVTPEPAILEDATPEVQPEPDPVTATASGGDPAVDPLVSPVPVEASTPDPDVPETAANTETTPADPTEAPPPAPNITLAEIHAVDGATCRRALFDPALRRLQPVNWGPEGFPTSTFAPTLCGIALTTPDGSPPAAPTASPPDAFLPADAPTGSLHLFFRTGVQNVVYTFPDSRDGASTPLSHEIKAPN